MLNAAVQNKGFSLAGLLSNVMVQDSTKYFAQFLTNPNGKSAESLADYLSKPDMQSAIAGGAEGFIGVTTRGADLKLSGLLINSEGEFCQCIKKGLLSEAHPVYGNSAPAKSGAGIGVPVLIRATHDAPSVFFCVDGLAHTFFSSAVIIRAAHEIMVGWMGASSEAPVTLIAGYANPVQSTTSLIGVFGGGFKPLIKEAASWLLPSPKLHQNLSGLSPQFAVIVRQSKLLSIISLPFQSKKLAALLCVSMFASLLAASLHWGCHMLKTYDLPIDPTERTAQLISLAELMRDVLESDSDSRDKYLAALVGLFDISIRDLHCLLEGNQLPEHDANTPVQAVSHA